ncbi:MAG: hypothetical protein JAY94_07725 [Candidatus Thiodiazotropha endolucinida]|nr:hypothetical protein [Candidatus Thiodiazotropha taylori]MCW4317390.1 hypothetical protein [Candidatus Thiodiazotropha taylori]
MDTTIVAALVALIGTLVAVGIGHNQWKKDKELKKKFKPEAVEAYRRVNSDRTKLRRFALQLCAPGYAKR